MALLIAKIYELGACFLYFCCVLAQNGGGGGGEEVTSQPFHPLGSALVSIQLATIKKKKLSKVTLNC